MRVEDSIRLVELRKTDLAGLSTCAVKNPKHEGRRRKSAWLETHFDMGLRLKTLVGEKGEQLGMIEYLPGECAWRGVEAPGYMFIHCLWTYSTKLKGTGLGTRLVRAAAEDAKKAGMNGVAVVTREGPWLAGSPVFLKNGFRVVETAPPDYELLALKFKRCAPDPKFKGGWEKKLRAYGRGLTIVRSNQCPHIAKFADDIAALAGTVYKLRPRVVEITNHREAENAPTPYAVFSVILDGRVLADHPISATRFRNIMSGLSKGPKPKKAADKSGGV
jgi:GNAT superfamily N-acetyltransferase